MIYLSLLCVSISLLALEITWMRLLSFQQWSHVASLVIALAMLGFAASGTYLAFLRDIVRRQWRERYELLVLLYAGSIPWAYWGLQELPLDPFMIVWDVRQGFFLLAYGFLLFFPFLLGAASVGILLCGEDLRVGPVYFVNLFGSGLGVLAALGFLLVFSIRTSLLVISLLGLSGALIMLVHGRRLRGVRAAVAVTAGMSTCFFLMKPIQISPNKPLARTLAIPDVTKTVERTSPWGTVHVLEGPALRSLPGLSLDYRGEIPGGRMVFLDGDPIGLRIPAHKVMEGPLDFFSKTIQSVGYETLRTPRVLVMGAGGGASVLEALWHGAGEVTLVEENPVILAQTRDWIAGFAGERFPTQRVTFRLSDARRFLRDEGKRFDLIAMDGLGSPGASFAGANAFQGDFRMTREGLTDLYEHLHAERGVLAFTFWAQLPPRETFKLIATLVEVYRSHGIPDASDYLFVTRGWSACTTLAFRSPLSARQVQAVRSFSERNNFDLVYYPGMTPDEANRLHRLEQPFYSEGVTALLGDRAEEFKEDYLFFVGSATDTKPYFHRFFKWKTFPSLWNRLGRDWVLLREWGYFALWATLVLVFLLGGAFLLLPMLFAKGVDPPHPPKQGRAQGRMERFLFFGCLGGAFMCFEMLWIEQCVFFLSNPLLSVSVIVAVILIFSSFGSLAGSRWMEKGVQEGVLLKSCFAAAGFGVLYAVGLMSLFRHFLDAHLLPRVIVALLALAPVCFVLGIPFPAAISWVKRIRPGDVPMCWGINGWTSVLFAALTPLLAVHMGLPGGLWIGAALYFCAGCLGMRMVGHELYSQTPV